MKEYYNLLKINEDASSDEIKKAYKKVAMKYHPDKNNGDKKSEDKFKKIQQAYDVLSNPEKKRNYDSFGSEDGPQRQRFGGGFEDIFGGMGFDPFSQFNQRQKRQKQGSNIKVLLTLKFEESINGKELDITLNRKEKCVTCSGTGSKDGKTSTCMTCGGSGLIGQGGGFFSIETECPNCGGSGQIPTEKCNNCNGKKYNNSKKTMHVKIQPGVKNGDKLILRNEGHQDGDVPGHVIIILNVKQHEYFLRDGNDIFIDIPITFIQAILGDKIEIPTIKNKVKLTIPKGTQTGKVFKLNKAGINGGDMFVRVNITVPEDIDFDSDIEASLINIENIIPSSKEPKPWRIKDA